LSIRWGNRIMFKQTTAQVKISKLRKRVRIVQGGTSSSKTFSIIPMLIDYAYKNAGSEISIVAETIPQLRRGALKDFLKIMDWINFYSDDQFNKSTLKYTFKNKSYIEFFSADQPSKLRGARRDVLFINEANNITFEAYHQLAIRTKKFIYLDYNPTSEFWVHTEINSDKDAELIILTYKDNEALDESLVKEIEKARDKAESSSYWANWWKVYGLGEIGSLQGVVFDNWQQVDDIPADAKLISYGMDFGFTNDPTTLIGVWKSEGKIWVDELLYRTNMTNNDIGNFLKSIQFERKELICDSAEPKSIEELRRQGFNVQPALKGADSINIGIDILKRYELCVTKRSTNLIKELRAYQWETDREGKLTGKPIDTMNHLIDPLRYVGLLRLNNRPSGKYQTTRI
jgi:phage terminase large subunit